MINMARVSAVCTVLAGLAMLLGSSSVQAAPGDVALGFNLTMEGMTQDTGSDVAAAVAPANTNIIVTDSRALKPGMYLQLQSGADWEAMLVVAASGDGPCVVPNGCAINDNVTVVRAQRGTTAGSYAIGVAVFATFVRVPVDVSGIANFDTGADLAVSLDTQTFDQTGAVLVEGVNTSATQLKVSDVQLIPYPSQIQIGSETMNVIIASFGLNMNSGVTLQEDVLFNADTELNISNRNLLQVGWKLRIEAYFDAGGTDPGPPEEMLIVGLSGDGPGGVQDTMTVVRGTTILNLLSGSTIFSGQDRLTVVRSGSPASHSAAAPISASFKIARVTDQTLIGAGSNIRIDSEVMQIRQMPSRHFHTSGAALASAANASASVIRVTDADLIDDGDRVRVDVEQMLVHRADAGCDVQAGAKIIAAMDAVQTTVAVNDTDLLQVGCTVTVGSEEMRIEGVAPANPPGQPEPMMTVARAFNDTTGAPHPLDAPITTAQDSMRVTRGAYATAAASHALAAQVHELTPELNTMKLSRLGTPASHASGSSIIDVDGLGGYALTLNAPAPASGAATNAAVSNVQTVISITNGAALQPGWVVVVDNEKMKIVSASPTSMTVTRGVHGTVAAAHSSGASIRGPVVVEFNHGRDGLMLTSTGRTADCSASPPALAVEGLSLGCSSTGTPLGPIGSGTLAFVDLWGQQLLPNTPTTPLTISPAVADLSGNTLPAQGAPSQAIKVVKCGDVNGNGVMTNADAIAIQQAVFGAIPPVPATMDININGVLTNGDATLVRQVIFIAQPAGAQKRCLPSGP